MTDDRLVRGLRALDQPVDADPAFADSLYSVLEGEVARRHKARPTMVLLVAAALLIAALLGVAMAVGSGLVDLPFAVRDDRVDPLPSHPSLPDSASLWSRVALPDGAFPEGIGAATTGLYVVGRDDGAAAVWTSGDGVEWRRVTDDAFARGSVQDIATVGDTIVAVGYVAERIAADPRAKAGMVWTSTDGVAWVQRSAETFDSAWLSAVSPGGPGVVALGTDLAGPAAWFSTDGVVWELAQVPPIPSFAAGDYAVWGDVVSIGDRIVAGGVAELSGRGVASEQYLLWTSEDGRTWTEVSPDEVVLPGASVITGLAVGTSGIVMVGRGPLIDEPAVWFSADGRSWHRAPPEQEGFGSRFRNGFAWGGLRAVAAGPGGYVAVGGDGQCGGGDCPSAEAAVWTSTDGETWARVPTDAVFQTSEGQGWVGAWDVVAWGSRFAMTGEWDAHSAVWVSTLGEE